MKKTLSLILALVTILSFAVVPSFAADEKLEFSLTNAAGVQNDYVTVTMSIDSNPGFWAFEFGLFYDSDALILRKVKVNNDFGALGDFYTFNDTTMNNLREQYDENIESGIIPLSRIFRDAPKFGVDVDSSYITVIEYESKDLTNDNKYTGNILELTFEVMGIAEDGDYNVTLVPDPASIINTSLTNDDVPYAWKNSVITIGTGATAKPDDENKLVTPTDTVKVETTDNKEDTENNDIINGEQPTVDTFVDDDGKTYYIGNDGEKHEYDSSSVQEDLSSSSDSEKSDDINVDDENAEKEKKDSAVLIILCGAAALLLVAAAVIIIFILKTKKENEAVENDDNTNVNK